MNLEFKLGYPLAIIGVIAAVVAMDKNIWMLFVTGIVLIVVGYYVISNFRKKTEPNSTKSVKVVRKIFDSIVFIFFLALLFIAVLLFSIGVNWK